MSRILIVEDEVAIADLEKDYLELSGFEVEIENDGTKGLERALHEEFDLFILDLMLPGVDGFEICKKIRETNIDIRVVGSRTSGGETDYLSLIRKAVEYQNKNQISVSEGDSVWVVADGDVNYNNPDPITAKDSLLSKARKMADAKGIQIALSNPCFEFWYLLHFQYTTKFFKDYPAVKNALTTYLPDYEKTGDVYNQLAEHTAIAIQNAKRVEQYHLQNDSSKPFGIAVNPFTDIHQLVESLL